MALSCPTKRLACRLNNRCTNTLANTNTSAHTNTNTKTLCLLCPTKTDVQTLLLCDQADVAFHFSNGVSAHEGFSDDLNDNGFPAGMGRRDNKWVSWQMEKRGGQQPASHSHFQKYLSRLQNVFVYIAKCICLDCKMYLSRLKNIFV